MEGYIKLDRNLLKWGWKDVPEMVALWVEILLQANYADREYHGETFERGTFPTSLEKLSLATGLSVRQVRTCLDRLTKSGEITIKTTNRGTKIIVEKWALYQGCDSDSDKQTTNDRQTTDKQSTTLKEINKEINIKKKEIYKERKVSFTPPTVQEVNDYCRERGNLISAEQFVDFYASKNWYVGKNKMKDWRACVRTWERRDNSRQAPKVEELETYDGSANPVFTEDRRKELMARRQNDS